MITVAPKSRYKLLRQVGSGDFAVVYAARDMKLGRDVALKQIHAQFLADDKKLARYWREAQLLVSLEHPNVLTIYDVIKAHGCLVLELMQGSLGQLYAGRPAPLQDVRQMILQAASGLHYLHENGILHGDIKPANLLLSRQNLVKLGDFGLARRANDSAGSLLKGTTKYMAPELVSDQFGGVGPASDLYSLGFTALELMCGPDFDSLFPELNAFGRDQQLAWMMWHCSADRRLPEVPAMLEGVPEDLAAVLHKLTEKDPGRRYQSAAEVIADLSPGGPAASVGRAIQEEAAKLAAERARRQRRRRGVAAALAASLALCVAIALFPTSQPEPAPAPPPPQPIHGTVQHVALDEQKIVLDAGGHWKEVTLFHEDRIFLNRRQRQLRDLRVGDRVVVRPLFDSTQGAFQEIAAFRPDSHRGNVTSVQADEGKFVLAIEQGEGAGTELVLNVSKSTPLTLNSQAVFNGQAVSLKLLEPGDRVIVEHVEEETGRWALSLEAFRIVRSEGVVRYVDSSRGTLTFAPHSDPSELVTLPFDNPCEVTLNGLRLLDQQLLAPPDILPGDTISLRHGLRIVSLDAHRVFRDAGVIRSIGYDTRTLGIQREGDSAATVYTVPDAVTITLGNDSLSLDRSAPDSGAERVALEDLRSGDRVQLTHESPGAQAPAVLTLAAQRPAHPSKWALVVANQVFDDDTLSPLDHALADAGRLRDRLIRRYAVPPDQAVLLADASRVRLEQAIPPILARIPPDAELYVYVVTHGFAVKENVYLAPKDFAFSRMRETGLPLDWLVDQLDACQSGRKLLLLDACHAGSGPDLGAQPSTAEMIELLRELRRGGYPRTLHVLASCSAGERGLVAGDEPPGGLFAESLAEAFAGAADRARDNQLDFAELSQYVEQRVKSLSVGLAIQTPRLILPDDTPPRLTEEAKQAIQRLLAQFSQSKLDPLSVRLEAEQADRLAPGQPEPLLAGGILLFKAGDRDRALQMLERVRLAHGDNALAHQAVAWILFQRFEYAAGLKSLEAMVLKIPASLPDSDEYALSLCEWAGRLRELATNATWSKQRLEPTAAEAVDLAISERGDAARQKYAQGRKHVQGILAELDQRARRDPNLEARVKFEKRRIANFAEFSFESAVATLRDGLEQ